MAVISTSLGLSRSHLWIACEQGEGKKGGIGKREPVRMAKDFYFQMPRGGGGDSYNICRRGCACHVFGSEF